MRYQLTVDTGSVDGKRKQLRRRHRTEKEARAALAENTEPSQRGRLCAVFYAHGGAGLRGVAAFSPQDTTHYGCRLRIRTAARTW
ncbi:MAG: Arm DNA-binding domain-containing protein [Mycobacterium sp.]|uniref:Arm DNA-binding domain-containing protein n=1 Tax=Mycobacterium sp. TaxID=1785 RepID=UPI003F9AC16A